MNDVFRCITQTQLPSNSAHQMAQQFIDDRLTTLAG